jgi:protein-serine/threonine kinase
MATLTAPAPVYDLTFGEVDDDWTWPAAVSPRPPLPRAASTSYGYGVTVIGKGFEWGGSSGGGNTADKEEQQQVPTPTLLHKDLPAAALSSSSSSRTSTPNASDLVWPSPRIRPPPPPPLRAQSTSAHIARRIAQPLPMIASPRARHAGGPVFTTSPIASPISSRPGSPSSSLSRPPYVRSPTGTRPTTPRFRRRSSQQRVSLIAGRLSILSVADAGARHDVPQRLVRSGSARSFLSVASSVAPPTPNELRDEFLIGRSLSEFVIEREIGRGAYGVVKRAREMDENGKMGAS